MFLRLEIFVDCYKMSEKNPGSISADFPPVNLKNPKLIYKTVKIIKLEKNFCLQEIYLNCTIILPNEF